MITFFTNVNLASVVTIQQICDKILKRFDNGKYTCMILIELQKVFD